LILDTIKSRAIFEEIFIDKILSIECSVQIVQRRIKYGGSGKDSSIPFHAQAAPVVSASAGGFIFSGGRKCLLYADRQGV
jgi:hypothetical protein